MRPDLQFIHSFIERRYSLMLVHLPHVLRHVAGGAKPQE